MIRNLSCKCGNNEKIYINEESKVGYGSFDKTDTFFCVGCERLSTINTVKDRQACKNCGSQDLSKLFAESRVTCPKCLKKGFSGLISID